MLSSVTSQLKYSKSGFSCLQLDLYSLFYPGCEQEVGLCTFPIPGLLLWIPPAPLPLRGVEEWCCSRKQISLGKRRWIKRIYAFRCLDFYSPPQLFLTFVCTGVCLEHSQCILEPLCSQHQNRHNHSHLNSARWKSPVSASHDFTSKCLGYDSRPVL